MISFIYTLDYDDEERVTSKPVTSEPVTSEPQNRTCAGQARARLLPTSAQNPALFSSIRIYAVAEKYGIKDLKQLAQSRFSTWASNNWNHSEFLMMVQEVYGSTPSSDRGLRDI